MFFMFIGLSTVLLMWSPQVFAFSCVGLWHFRTGVYLGTDDGFYNETVAHLRHTQGIRLVVCSRPDEWGE